MALNSIPALPLPPNKYDQQYFDLLIKNLRTYYRQILNPGPILGTTLQLTSLPTAATGLPSGSVWVDTTASNVLKVVP